MTGGMQHERVAWVDAAKGLCIVFVVMMHSTLGVEKAAGATGWMGDVVHFAMPFRMPDFFLISGLFLSRVIDRPWRTFLDRRVLHFFYFYVLWLTIQFAMKAPGLAEGGIEGVLGAYLVALFVEPFGTLWFIWMLPVFALVVRLARRVPVPLMLAFGALLEILPIKTGWVVPVEFAARFVYFYAGYAFADHIFRFADTLRAHKAAALALLLAWGVVNGLAVFGGEAELPFLSLALGIAGALAVVTAATLLFDLPRVGEAIAWLGARSIVVYLAFFLPMVIARVAMLRLGFDVDVTSIVTTVAGVAVPFAIKAVGDRVGARFLFERPAMFHIEGTRPAAVQPSMKSSTARA